MKQISVPAQITTIEDRIVGNFTLTQLSLFAAPIFIDFGFYAALPRPLHLNLYKLILLTIVTPFFFVLAIRVKGKVILSWMITLARFRFRNKFYVFNKNSLYLRAVHELRQEEVQQTSALNYAKLSAPKIVPKIENNLTLDHLNLKLSFIEERKGRLYVYVNSND